MRFIAIVFAIAFAAAPTCNSGGTCNQCGKQPQEPISFPLEDFTLTERSGGKIGLDDLKGKVWVASFVFVRCAGPCPQVTATMARLQAEDPDLQLVTFTIDPTRDDPKELSNYAERYGADAKRWLFLTGDEEVIHRLSEKSFKLTAKRLPDAKPGFEFGHTSKLVVIDKQGNLRGYFDGKGEPAELTASLGQLKAMVNELNR